MSEVRPWIGALVSVALFETTSGLEVVDCSVHHKQDTPFYFDEPDVEARKTAVWTHIDHAFSEPVTGQDDVDDYVPTQILAELFKNAGYGGIAYKSKFGTDGYTVVLFDPNIAKVTYCELHEVTKAEFQFQSAHQPYWVQPDGTIVTQTIEIIGPAEPKSAQKGEEFLPE